MRETCLFTHIELGVLSVAESREGKKGVKRLSDTQRDPWKIETCRMINKFNSSVSGKGTSLSVHIAVFRIPAFNSPPVPEEY